MLGPAFLPDDLSSIPFAGHILTIYQGQSPARHWASIWENTEKKGLPSRKMALTVMKNNLKPQS